jgi:hypothetical protein
VGAPGVTGEIQPTQVENEDDEIQAKASVEFAKDDATRVLTITVEAKTDDDSTSARVKVSLGRIDPIGVSQNAVGPHTWSGVLCDGTAATVSYTVDPDGSLSNVTTTPAAKVNPSRFGATVHFDDHNKVKIRVKTEDGAPVGLQESPKLSCKSGPPTINVPVDASSEKQEGDDHEDERHDDDHDANDVSWHDAARKSDDGRHNDD